LRGLNSGRERLESLLPDQDLEGRASGRGRLPEDEREHPAWIDGEPPEELLGEEGHRPTLGEGEASPEDLARLLEGHARSPQQGHAKSGR
jgi:hypothetical protein